MFLLKKISSQKDRLFVSLIITIVFYIVLLPLNEHIAFFLPYLSHWANSLALVLKFFAFPVFLSLFYFILTFVSRFFAKDPFYLSWAKISAFYLAIMGIFLILIYPGHWVWDELDILEGVRQYSLFAWQNYLTNIFYTFSLYLIPSGIGIVLIQIGIISLIVGYIITLSKQFFTHRFTHFFLLIPFLFFPIIINNLYPLRLTLFSYILLLLFAQLFFLHKKVLVVKQPLIFFLQAAFLIAIVSYWRTEGFIYILLLPIFAHKLGIFRRQALKKPAVYATCLLTVGFFGLGYYITSSTTSNKYQITATLNPLATMIQGQLRGKDTPKDLEAINRVIDLSIVKKYPSYTEIPSFWLGAVRDDYYVHLEGYNTHTYRIILNNPGPFFENRIQVFLHTNSLGVTSPLGIGRLLMHYPVNDQAIQHFYAVNILSRPFSERIKRAVTEKLLLVEDNNLRPSFLAKFVWSIIPTIIILLLLMVILFIRRQWLVISLITMLLGHTSLIFLTAPANYFMYYLPIYLVGNFLVSLFLLRYLEKNPVVLRLRNRTVKLLKTNRPLVFLLVGLANTALDFLFFTFLIHFIFRSPDMILSVGIISGTFALICAYTTHSLITWRDKRTTKTTMIKFFAVTGFGLWIIRPLLLAFFITFAPLYTQVQSLLPFFSNYTIASTCAFIGMAAIVMVYNYLTYARFVFIEEKTSLKRRLKTR